MFFLASMTIDCATRPPIQPSNVAAHTHNFLSLLGSWCCTSFVHPPPSLPPSTLTDTVIKLIALFRVANLIVFFLESLHAFPLLSNTSTHFIEMNDDMYRGGGEGDDSALSKLASYRQYSKVDSPVFKIEIPTSKYSYSCL